MLPACHSGKSGHRLALTAGGHDTKLLSGIASYHFDIHKQTFRYLQISQLDALADNIHHAPAGNSYLSAGALADVDYLLYAVDI